MADQDGGGNGKSQQQNMLEAQLARRWDATRMSSFLRESGTTGSRMDFTTRSMFERRLGVDMGGVRLITGTLADELTQAHGAEALTVGDTGMVLMSSRVGNALSSAHGMSILAHELTHVAQSRPSAMARKAVSDFALATDESEDEAEAVEAEFYSHMAEGTALNDGGSGGGGGGGGGKGIDPEKLMNRVLELFADDVWLNELRWGTRRTHPDER
jgi:hypothetical protein